MIRTQMMVIPLIIALLLDVVSGVVARMALKACPLARFYQGNDFGVTRGGATFGITSPSPLVRSCSRRMAFFHSIQNGRGLSILRLPGRRRHFNGVSTMLPTPQHRHRNGSRDVPIRTPA